ncbi:DUF2637 domain-containing protein [Actinoplanes hulinensis]|uniref:DUF2637 domain-containing protein n=1 Tax=Actinoplanes hulinensis TaxID=1144547 RepID=A0ABS7AUW0_9ACTN|nr:DUF2637 domain-containing protein [Actinoplanes hulinensis]MBW6432409.1 DUF2637 domain-containing protein [Actinoplanes hulinensis]
MTTTRHRDGWVMVGMAVAAASAATASFTGLRGLALAAGWPERLAWLLPLTIDAYAMTSTRVWLAPGRSRSGRGYAQANAIGAIGASIIGNAVYHMLTVGLLTVSWPIVVSVGAVPAAVLGLTAHLHALRSVHPEEANRPREDGARSGTRDGTEDGAGNQSAPVPETLARTGPESGRRSRRRAKPRTDDQLMAAAREADARYRAGHDGHPITRDALRTALRIAGPRATELRRRLTAESSEPTPAATSDRKEAQPAT